MHSVTRNKDTLVSYKDSEDNRHETKNVILQKTRTGWFEYIIFILIYCNGFVFNNINGLHVYIFCKHLLGTKKTSSNIGVRAELGINQDVYVGQGKLLTMIIAIPWITGVTLYWVLVTILSALTTRPENGLF